MRSFVFATVLAGSATQGCSLTDLGSLQKGAGQDGASSSSQIASSTGSGLGGMGGAGAGGTAGGGPSGSGGGASSTGAGAPGCGSALLFSDDFTADPTLWTFTAGSWARDAKTNEMEQTDASVIANAFVPSRAGLVDCCITTRMRQLPPGTSPAGAMNLIFRVTPDPSGQLYSCNWEPNYIGFRLMKLDGAASTFLAQKEQGSGISLPSAYDPLETVTMHVRLEGSAIHCWLDEITGADIFYNDVPTPFPGGSFGLRTYQMAAAFDDVKVVEIQ